MTEVRGQMEHNRKLLSSISTRKQVELELRLHMTNLCLAVLSKEPGVLQECKETLVNKVCDLIKTRKPS